MELEDENSVLGEEDALQRELAGEDDDYHSAHGDEPTTEAVLVSASIVLPEDDDDFPIARACDADMLDRAELAELRSWRKARTNDACFTDGRGRRGRSNGGAALFGIVMFVGVACFLLWSASSTDDVRGPPNSHNSHEPNKQVTHNASVFDDDTVDPVVPGPHASTGSDDDLKNWLTKAIPIVAHDASPNSTLLLHGGDHDGAGGGRADGADGSSSADGDAAAAVAHDDADVADPSADASPAVDAVSSASASSMPASTFALRDTLLSVGALAGITFLGVGAWRATHAISGWEQQRKGYSPIAVL